MRAARNTALQYPGSKARISPWIISHLPRHNTYVEPLGGSAAVLLNKDSSPNEVYNDVDGDLVHFFTTLRDHGDDLREWLQQTPYSRELFDEYLEDYFKGIRPEDDVERAGRYFYIRQASFNGKIEESQSFSVCTESRGYPSDAVSTKFRNRVENLRVFADRFRGVTIENDDYADVVKRYDSETAVFYLDPPYVEVGSEYYEHGEFDHSDLIGLLRGIDGRAAISYEELPNDIPDTWTVVSRPSKSTLNRGSGDDKEGTERLILTYDPAESTRFSQNQSLGSFGGDDDA